MREIQNAYSRFHIFCYKNLLKIYIPTQISHNIIICYLHILLSDSIIYVCMYEFELKHAEKFLENEMCPADIHMKITVVWEKISGFRGSK